MAKKSKKVKSVGKIEVMRFTASPHFIPSYQEFFQKNPKIDIKLEEFRRRKSKKPPETMPGEHPLIGRLEGVRECHLAGDILILWQEKNDTIHQLLICNHADIKGSRESSTVKKIKPHYK